MDIRPLTPNDTAQLLPLIDGLAAHHGETSRATADTLARDLADGWLWGFGAGDPMVGYVLVMRRAEAQSGLRGVDLHHVYVTPEARGQGVARALIGAAEADARDRGCSYVLIGAHDGNEAARDAYVALGYDWTTPTFWRFRKTL